MKQGALLDSNTNRYYLTSEKKIEVLKDLKMADPYLKETVMKRIDLPFEFGWVRYYYFIPRWIKMGGYHVGLFFGGNGPTNLSRIGRCNN